MCGLVGYSLARKNKHMDGLLHDARQSLRHRGPDGFGFFKDEAHGVGLAHSRLAIQDLSPSGHQPMLSEDGRVAIVFNGEIYNFGQLRTDLERGGACFTGRSDTEVLLKLYLSQRDAPDAIGALLRRLNGVFAFALWDADLESLVLARDALGVKPLYLSEGPGGIVFGSEIKAFLPFTNIINKHDCDFRKINPIAIDRYVSHLWCPGDATPLQHVVKLSPGQSLRVRHGRITERLRWYVPPVFRAIGERRRRSRVAHSEQEFVDGTRTSLREAVHRQMVSEVPVGAFLSGGVDSSSVVAFAREISPDIRCFSIAHQGIEEEGVTYDLPFAQLVARHLKVPLDIVQVDAQQMASDFIEMVRGLDEPLADTAPLNVLYISRLARKQGIKVLLSGTGGDDLFSGYRRHHGLITEGWWNWLPSSALMTLERVSKLLNSNKPFGRRIRKLLSGAALTGDARLINYFRWIDRDDLQTLYTPSFRAALVDQSDPDPMLAFLAELPSDTDRLERMLALEQRFFLADHNLAYTDKMSMAVGVEVRVPFLDLELVEFAAQIPSRLKQRGTVGKWVLKKAMEPYLPREVIHRSKTGFGAPLRRWLRVELRDWLMDTLSTRRLNHRGLFDSAAVHRLIRNNADGRVDASYTLLSLACIEVWCQNFIDNRFDYSMSDSLLV